jgi:poly [ADP-ribose] polymerase
VYSHFFRSLKSYSYSYKRFNGSCFCTGGGGGGDTGDGAAGASGYNDFNVEYAKSNRSTCRGCDSKIDKDDVRISKKDYETERAKMYGPQDAWYHVDCFKDNRDDLDFGTDMSPEK